MNDYQTGKNMNNSGILQQQAHAMGGQSLYNTAAVAPQRRLEGCLKRFEHLLSCYADIANQAEALASSIAGPSPETNGANLASPPPTALIGQLEGIAEQFDGRMQRIQSALKRLQEL